MNLSKHILDYRKKQTGTLLISENITFANDDVMNYVTGASSKNCPGPPYPLIRLWYKKLPWSFNDTFTWKRDQMPHPQQVSCFPEHNQSPNCVLYKVCPFIVTNQWYGFWNVCHFSRSKDIPVSTGWMVVSYCLRERQLRFGNRSKSAEIDWLTLYLVEHGMLVTWKPACRLPFPLQKRAKYSIVVCFLFNNLR